MNAVLCGGGGDGGCRQSLLLSAFGRLMAPLAVVMLVTTSVAVESGVVPGSKHLLLQPTPVNKKQFDVHAVIGKPSPTGSWFQVLLAAQQDDAVPIRRQYKQLLEYDTENPVALATAAKSPETREKYSGELDDAGKPVIISHNYKEHHLSAKDRQQIFEAPFHLLNADKGEVTYYQIASPFRRHDFRLPKDPLILASKS